MSSNVYLNLSLAFSLFWVGRQCDLEGQVSAVIVVPAIHGYFLLPSSTLQFLFLELPTLWLLGLFWVPVHQHCLIFSWLSRTYTSLFTTTHPSSGFSNGMQEIFVPDVLNFALSCRPYLYSRIHSQFLFIFQDPWILCSAIWSHSPSIWLFFPDGSHATSGLVIFVRQDLSVSQLSTSSYSLLDPYLDYTGTSFCWKKFFLLIIYTPSIRSSLADRTVTHLFSFPAPGRCFKTWVQIFSQFFFPPIFLHSSVLISVLLQYRESSMGWLLFTSFCTVLLQGIVFFL